jgi:deazaflavin-dependent oxidoreductase (nitroreductase family)
MLRRVEPGAAPSLLRRIISRLSITRPVRFMSRHLAWKLDPLLLRLSGNRISTTMGIPSGLLETRGARTGETRRNAVIYFHDGGRVVIAASFAGAPRHPAWYHNLRAHPEVTFGGVPMRAAVVEDAAERERLWDLADRVFPGFAVYRREAAAAGRTIPLVALAPR